MTARIRPGKPAKKLVHQANLHGEVMVCLAHLADRVVERHTNTSGAVEEPVENARTELQRVDRDPLVDAVEERREVQIGRQP
jgi:hypothetical protein